MTGEFSDRYLVCVIIATSMLSSCLGYSLDVVEHTLFWAALVVISLFSCYSGEVGSSYIAIMKAEELGEYKSPSFR